jgi:hypothetical protein
MMNANSTLEEWEEILNLRQLLVFLAQHINGIVKYFLNQLLVLGYRAWKIRIGIRFLSILYTKFNYVPELKSNLDIWRA